MSGEKRKKVGSCMIPAPIMARADLTLTMKAVYGKVYSFTFHADRGVCDAGNAYLGRQVGISPETASNYISKLVRMGLLERRVVRDDRGQVVKRTLTAVEPATAARRATSRAPTPSPLRDGDPSPLRDGIDVGVVTVECSCSSLRSSPGEPGQGEETDNGDDTEPPPDLPAFAAEGWVRGVQGGTCQLSEGVYPLLWRGSDVPQRSPPGWGFRAEMGTLGRFQRDYGASDLDLALFVVGLHRMREAGDLGGVDPGEPVTTGYAAASEAWDAEVLWHAALRRGRRWWQEVCPTDAGVLDLVAGGAHA